MNPAYYLASRVDSKDLRGKVTPDVVLVLLGYGGSGWTEEQMAVKLMAGESVLPEVVSQVPRLWQEQHRGAARQAYSLLRPEVMKLEVGVCLGRDSRIGYLPDDFSWIGESPSQEPSQILYTCPYSQQLPRFPSPQQEIIIACMFGMTGFTRPTLDHLIWTPGGSMVVSYSPETVLTEGITIRRLWEEFLLPRIQGLVERMSMIGLPSEPSATNFIPIIDPLISPSDLIKRF